MELKVGQSLKINGKDGVICFVTSYNDNKYVNICFGEEKLEYKVYKYEFENDSVHFIEEIDENTLSHLTGLFVSEALGE